MTNIIVDFVIGILLFVVDIFYGGFVFQYGWNHFIHEIGFPTINYITAIGIGFFIDMCKYSVDIYKEPKDRERKDVSEMFVETFMRFSISLIIMIIINLFM